MYVAVCRLTLAAPGTRSLKEKRAILRRIKDRTRNRFSVSIAEVDAQDAWGTIVLGLAAVGADGVVVEGVLDKVVGFIQSLGVADVVDDCRDLVQFGVELGAGDGWLAAKYGGGDE